MARIRNIVTSFLIFATLTTLIVNFYSPFETNYDITPTELDNGMNIFEKLASLNIIEGIDKLVDGAGQAFQVSGDSDILGGIALVATGTLQVIGGIITFPVEIFGVISGFYGNVIPEALSQLIGLISAVTVLFILISAKLGFEL